VGTTAVIVAVLALLMAAVGLVIKGGDDDSVSTGGPVTVELTEFAITPASVTVPAGGSLQVTNAGATAHNLTIQDSDVATAELAAGETEDLDVSSLAPGDYEILCTIPGHVDSGMTGTLTVTEGSGSGSASGSGDTAAVGDMAGMDHSGSGDEMTEADYEAMDQAMEESIAAYPAETEGVGNELLEPKVLDDGTKQFELTAAITPWEVEPGKTVDAWTYNGMAPGPMMHVEVGDKVQIVLHNELPMGTDIHLHGINVPNSMDGVAPLTQDLVVSAESFTYEFTTDEPAVAMYHAHHHAQMQVPNGLFGTFLVGEMPLPAGRTISTEVVPDDVEVSQELPMVLNDTGVIGYSLNGKSFPATAPVTAKKGDWILVHYFNEGAQIHPMHLHQFDQIVVAKDGYPLDQPYVVDTLNVAPGERYSVLVQLDEPGTWVWHCHILNHVESEEGMFGMVTAVVVE
jgi:FtsP/CotA-like multicopper oxidase with cupredoxin domain